MELVPLHGRPPSGYAPPRPHSEQAGPRVLELDRAVRTCRDRQLGFSKGEVEALTTLGGANEGLEVRRPQVSTVRGQSPTMELLVRGERPVPVEPCPPGRAPCPGERPVPRGECPVLGTSTLSSGGSTLSRGKRPVPGGQRAVPGGGPSPGGDRPLSPGGERLSPRASVLSPGQAPCPRGEQGMGAGRRISSRWG